MKITIIYDNEAFDKSLKNDRGFSCLIEVFGRKILFDTGANSDILLGNMKKLNIDPEPVDMVFISHSHWDHIGGLHGFKEFELIQNLKSICPTHCTQFKEKIRSFYPDKYIEGGAGRVITI